MRPRRKKALGSLDSLLDTMTNVVGILVILLAVTQLGVGDAVKRIRGALVEVSSDEIAQLQAQTVDMEKLVEAQMQAAKEANDRREIDQATLDATSRLIIEQRIVVAELKKREAETE